jgi:hypothetical protein
MANAKILKKYLTDGEDSYLISSNNNGKVIMLSGKWGSGKTYFWQNKIQTVLNDKEIKIPNHYISLYGKISIQEIKNEIFLKVFESVDSFKSEEKTKKIVKGSIDLVSSLTKSISVFGMSLDLSKITDTSFKKIDDLLNDEKLKRTENYLNSGAIICFDDFERKSKDIDLNDLFGFITQLTLNFNCKVVIILNDDVFEGEEKKIFSNVKEKSVSKFLKYEPSIRDLFNLIFYGRREDNKKKFKYLELRKYKQIILKTIEETGELNARIYIQVLDNLVEWIDKKQETNENVLRCLILVNINFINHHTIMNSNLEVKNFTNPFFQYMNLNIYTSNYKTFLTSINNNIYKQEEKNYESTNKIENKIRGKLTKLEVNEIIEFININNLVFKSIYFANNLQMAKNVDDKTFQKINNFIETGIL